LDTATLPPEIEKAMETRKQDDIFFIRSRTNASFFKVASVEDKPLSGEEAQQFAKRELRNELAKKAAGDTYAAALANAKYEGDYTRIMAASTPAAPPAAVEAPAAEGQTGEKPAAESNAKPESDKEAPKN
jgi:hypothetical protein